MIESAKKYRPSLKPLIAKARAAFTQHVVSRYADRNTPGEPPLVLIACSGGPDSLTLASIAAFYHRKQLRVGAIVLDHSLQPQTSHVSQETATILKKMGLSPVIHQKITVTVAGSGVEAAARSARYRAFADIAHHHGAVAVLTAHHHNDQAEQVLLGLARGSGTSSLAGIAPHQTLIKNNNRTYYRNKPMFSDMLKEHRTPDYYAVDIIRPFLSLTKKELEQICHINNINYWNDPANSDHSYLRSKIRTRILPYLNQELSPAITAALNRTAVISRADNEFIQTHATIIFRLLAEVNKNALSHSPQLSDLQIFLDISALRALPEAIRLRLYREANTLIQGVEANESLTLERAQAVDKLVFCTTNNKIVQTPSSTKHQYLQWLKQKESTNATQKATTFFTTHGTLYTQPQKALKTAETPHNHPPFNPAGKYGTLVVQLENI